jgi:DNA-binding transcriptional ArsR family regulator
VSTYAATAIGALGDPTRRTIFERLAGGPQPVGRIALDLPVSRPAVSQHLRVLKEAGLVIDRPDGNRRLYELNPDGVEALRAYFDRFWNHALERFKKSTEQQGQEDP